MAEGNDLIERLIAVADRFDPEQDGTGIGQIASEDVMYMANYIVDNPNSGISRDYMARVQARELLGGQHV